MVLFSADTRFKKNHNSKTGPDGALILQEGVVLGVKSTFPQEYWVANECYFFGKLLCIQISRILLLI